jgi:putative sigma-54 modulation protein
VCSSDLTSDRLTLYAKDESDNMYSSIDIVVDKLKKQLTKTLDKINKRATNTRESIKNGHDVEEIEESADDDFFDSEQEGMETDYSREARL